MMGSSYQRARADKRIGFRGFELGLICAVQKRENRVGGVGTGVLGCGGGFVSYNLPRKNETFRDVLRHGRGGSAGGEMYKVVSSCIKEGVGAERRATKNFGWNDLRWRERLALGRLLAEHEG